MGSSSTLSVPRIQYVHKAPRTLPIAHGSQARSQSFCYLKNKQTNKNRKTATRSCPDEIYKEKFLPNGNYKGTKPDFSDNLGKKLFWTLWQPRTLTSGSSISLQVLTPTQNQSSGLYRVTALDNRQRKSFLSKPLVTTTSSSRADSHSLTVRWQHLGCTSRKWDSWVRGREPMKRVEKAWVSNSTTGILLKWREVSFLSFQS